MSRHDELEERVTALIHKLGVEFSDLDGDLRWSITRALIHRAIHYATDGAANPVEYCSLATYLAEMVGHAHKLAHGENPKGQSHRDTTH